MAFVTSIDVRNDYGADANGELIPYRYNATEDVVELQGVKGQIMHIKNGNYLIHTSMTVHTIVNKYLPKCVDPLSMSIFIIVGSLEGSRLMPIGHTTHITASFKVYGSRASSEILANERDYNTFDRYVMRVMQFRI